MTKRSLFENIASFLLSFLLLLAGFSCLGGEVLRNGFDALADIDGWLPYTNDDNKEQEWDIEGGSLFQKTANSDKAPGGERFLFKPEVFDLQNLQFPLEVWFDVFPFDYGGENEVWFGLILFANSKKPDRDEIVVALKRDESRNKCGLTIAVGGKAWLLDDDNITTPSFFWQWNRFRVRIEKPQQSNSLKLLCKTWGEQNAQPEKWKAAINLPLSSYPLKGSGVGFGMNALYGAEQTNPRALFDNLIVTDNGKPATLFPMKTKQDGDWLRQLKFGEFHEMLETGRFPTRTFTIRRFGTYCPEFKGSPGFLFLEMLEERENKNWDKARSIANRIFIDFPDSRFAQMMGGKEGRTEEEAALKYAEGITKYNSHKLKECIGILTEFLNQYPNNWRKRQAYYYLCHSYYWLEQYKDLFKYTRKFHEEFGRHRDAERILILEISTHIHETNQDSARKLIDQFRDRFPESTQKNNIDQLELETYFYKKNMDITLADWKEPNKRELLDELEGELIYFTDKWLRTGEYTWFSKNLGFIVHLYERTDRRQDALDYIDQMISITLADIEARRRAYDNFLVYLLDIQNFEMAEKITQLAMRYEKDPKEKENLENKLLIILNKMEKNLLEKNKTE